MPKLKDMLSDALRRNPHTVQAELAKILHVDPDRMNEILNCKCEIGDEEYNRIQDFLEQTSTSGEVYDEDQKQWPLSHKIIGRERKEAPINVRHSFQVNDHMMEPRLTKYEYVMLDVRSRPNSEALPFVVSDGKNKMVRLCRALDESHPAKIEITACAEDFEPQILSEDDFTIVGKVIAKLSWV